MVLSLNNLEVKNHCFIKADGTQSIYFLSGGLPMSTYPDPTANQVGRITATTSQMYLDFNDVLNVRYYTNKNNTSGLNTALSTYTFTGLGLSINTTTASSTTGTGALVVSGGAGISGNINVGGESILKGKVGIGKDPVSPYILDVSGPVNVSTTLKAVRLNTTYLYLGNGLVFGLPPTTVTASQTFTFPLQPFYYVNPVEGDPYIVIRLPDVNLLSTSIPPFQFTLFNMNTPLLPFGIQPYTTGTPTNLYSPMRQVLASTNQTYNVNHTSSSCITIMFWQPHWVIMYPF